ncbi:J domain-containing protein required for chloroplast accumulation response 1 [Actinidia eriantha]|uniref:J domain-containing protein required for chloroplast accumulation response 1 n=1 Tax=Actinidia eriantha TaxID=165200 RepID=UPI002586439F|nr:J domain-containing protein required for chloroplast accumulation response 1 [Actinidia eriantha]
MERFPRRENVLPGHGHQRPFGNQISSPKTPLKQQDEIDFQDVFGGPPRRSSMQETRYNFAETANSNINTRGEEEDTVLPAFGEETVNRRRQYPSDNFFDDIFRGDDSVSVSSPRRSNNDPYGSTPGSRVLSPARPLPPRADVFGSSLPSQSQFSLPAKLTTAVDFPVSASSSLSSYKYKNPTSNEVSSLYNPRPPMSRLSGEGFQDADELRNETRPSHCPSPLSHEFSFSRKESSYVTKYSELESMDKGSNLKRDLKTTEASNNGSQFHFSIYKWASKGVPLLTPLRGCNNIKSKERFKTDRCSSTNGRIESDDMANGLQTEDWCDSDLHYPNQSVSANDEPPYTEGRKEERGTFLDKVEPCHIVEEAVLSMPGSKSINKISNIIETVPGDDILSDKSEEIKPHSLFETDFCGSTDKEFVCMTPNVVEIVPGEDILHDKREEIKPRSLSETDFQGSTEKGIPTCNQEAKKSESMTLRSLFNNTNDDQGNDEMIRKSEGNDTVKKRTVSDSNKDVSKNLKKYDVKSSSNRERVTQMNEPHLQDSNRKSGDNLGRKGAKGKVKEFVKIFNQDAGSKPKISIETRSKSTRWRRTGPFGEDKEPSANTTHTYEKNHFHSVDKMKKTPNASTMVDKNLNESEKQQSQTTFFDVSEKSFSQKDASATSSDLFPDGSKVTEENIDDLFQENFMVKELSNDQDKPLLTGDGHEDVQTSNAKIRQWSNGKEGNIRSLLSTLQYVLWPGCGWKPVPLVDIIEGNAVKRAYQKALLCLHPDKLQQKGAAAHQKYIAEKVFDILQEAWDHFNSSGAI